MPRPQAGNCIAAEVAYVRIIGITLIGQIDLDPTDLIKLNRNKVYFFSANLQDPRS